MIQVQISSKRCRRPGKRLWENHGNIMENHHVLWENHGKSPFLMGNPWENHGKMAIDMER